MRARCEGCRAEYLLALSCKPRYFCPSCHAKRLACWTQWLGEELLAPVAHRQWRRKLLGDPLVCPKCAGRMRMITLIQEPKVIDKILKHLRTKGRDARAGPWATAERSDWGGGRGCWGVARVRARV